jgi:hypothetical protein
MKDSPVRAAQRFRIKRRHPSAVPFGPSLALPRPRIERRRFNPARNLLDMIDVDSKAGVSPATRVRVVDHRRAFIASGHPSEREY